MKTKDYTLLTQLQKNKFKLSPKHPDWFGRATIDGREYTLAGFETTVEGKTAINVTIREVA